MQSKRADSLHSRLELATRALHRRAEGRLALDRPGWTNRDYVRLLQEFWGFYVPLERQMQRVDWRESGIEIGLRLKSPLLRSDLIYLGMTAEDIDGLPLTTDLPLFDSVEAGFGALYVVEGATLGGRVILKSLQVRLGVSPAAGGRFFNSYGADVGLMWRGYLTSLERLEHGALSKDKVVLTAQETFQAFDVWFSRWATSAPGRRLIANE